MKPTLSKGEIEGLKHALAIVGDLRSRTAGTGVLGDAFREAYGCVERVLVEKIAIGEAALHLAGGEQRAITEDDKAIIDGWYKRAREIQPGEIGEFVRHLCEDYRHDYGTVVHACAAAAVAGAWAISRGNNGGGITGFQAGCVFWSFYQKWMSEDGPVRLLKFENLLYPQYDGQHQELPKKTWEWLREKAKALVLVRDNAHPNVLERWKSIAEGIVPPGWRLEDR